MSKLSKILGLILAGAFVLTGCTSTSDPGSAQIKTDKAEPTEVTKVLVANAGDPKPYNWVEEDGTLAGYEVEVIRAVDELLPEYEFVFEKTQFSSIFTGIDSGIYDMGFNYITWRESRLEKYYYATVPHMYVYMTAIVRKGDTSIQGIDDLGGKTVYTAGSGSSVDEFIENYNEANPDNPINVVYTDGDKLVYYRDLVAGKIDVFFTSKPEAELFFEAYPDYKDQVDIIRFSKEDTQEIEDPYGWFIYPKTDDGAALRDAVDGALLQLIDDGTLSALSEEYLGFDFVNDVLLVDGSISIDSKYTQE